MRSLIAENAYSLCYVCRSVRSSVLESHETVSFKFDIGNVYESAGRIQIWLKLGRKYLAFYLKTYICFIVAGDINLS
jgi:hypothetical protein